MQNSGAYMEKKIAGIHHVRIQGLNTGTLDLSNNEWGHKVVITIFCIPLQHPSRRHLYISNN